MEAAIRTPEILDLVFQHLRFTEDLSVLEERTQKAEFLERWRRKRSTLLHAALACKAFFQPAMANLWWIVDGIMPFIKLLPHIHSKASQSGYHYLAIREWSLDNVLEEEGLERFDFYAKLVTHIIDLSRMGEDSISSVLIQLAEIRPSRRCFPRLRTVKTNSFNPDPLFFYTPSSLQVLKLRGFWTDDRFKPMCNMLGRLPGHCPDLQVLDVPYVPNLQTMHAVLRLQNLRSLSVAKITIESLDIQEFLKHTADLPRLQKLDVTLPADSDSGHLILPLDYDPITWFPALTSISASGRPHNLISLIRYIKSTDIEEVDFRLSWGELHDVQSPEVAEQVTALTQTIQSHLSLSLKSVSISVDQTVRMYIVMAGGRPVPVPLTADFIKPLLSMPTLETVLLDPSLYIPGLTDDFLLPVSQSWPRLLKLSLPSSGVGKLIPFTFPAVQQMVAGLPHLNELSVDFVASGTPALNLEAPQLKVLNVRSSPIQNKKSTAVNLARAFPNLETLRFTPDQTSKYYSNMWKEVAAWLPVITGKYSAVNGDDDSDVGGPASPPVQTSAIPTVVGPHFAISDTDSEDPLGYDSEEY